MKHGLICFFLMTAWIDSALAFSWTPRIERRAVALIEELRVRKQVPSIAFSVTLDDTIVLSRDIGVTAPRSGPTGTMAFSIGSISKQFTAAAVLALIEDRAIVPMTGKPLTLDTPLTDLFTDVEHWSTPDAPNTIRRLLTMTANIPEIIKDPYFIELSPLPIKASAMLDQIKTYELAGKIGQYMYANTNYFLLAEIISIVGGPEHSPDGPAFHDYLRSRIFARAGLKLTEFLNEKLPFGVVAAIPIFRNPPDFSKPDWPKGAGDLVSTAGDLARWNIALMSGRLIDQVSLAEMLHPAIAVEAGKKSPYAGWSYAMGWFVRKYPWGIAYEHDGQIAGFTSLNLVATDKSGGRISVTLLANIDNAGLQELARDIVTLARTRK